MKFRSILCSNCIFGLCVEESCGCENCEFGEGMAHVATGSIYQKEAMRTANGTHEDLLQNGVMGLMW